MVKQKLISVLLWQLENMDTSQADAPRVADLKFQLEKRDSTVTDLEATVDKLNVCTYGKTQALDYVMLLFRVNWKR